MRNFRKNMAAIRSQMQCFSRICSVLRTWKISKCFFFKNWEFNSLSHKSPFLCIFLNYYLSPEIGQFHQYGTDCSGSFLIIQTTKSFNVGGRKHYHLNYHHVFIYWLHGYKVAHLETLTTPVYYSNKLQPHYHVCGAKSYITILQNQKRV